MRYCPSCRAEPGEYHLPACENGERDERGRFLEFVPVWTMPKPRPIPDIEASLHGGLDDEGDER